MVAESVTRGLRTYAPHLAVLGGTTMPSNRIVFRVVPDRCVVGESDKERADADGTAALPGETQV